MSGQRTRVALGMFLFVTLGIVLSRLSAQEKTPLVELHELQKERLAVLKQLKALTEEWYGIGKTTINAVHQVRMQLLDAQLELVTQLKEQLKLREDFAKEAEVWEQKAARSVKDGHKPGIDAVIAKAFRLDAQIAMEKARAQLPGRRDNK